MDFDKKKGVFQWLLSLSEQNRGMLGLGRGLHSHESLSTNCQALTMVISLCAFAKSKYGRLRSDIDGIKNEREKNEDLRQNCGWILHLHSPKIIL